MACLPHCYYSNRVEILFDNFKERLFADSHPLTKRLVIVPSHTVRTWLLHRLAQDLDIGVAAGIEVGFVEPTLNKLCGIFAPNQYKLFLESEVPSALELALALEREIALVARTFDSLSVEEQRIWQPMFSYLQTKGGGAAPKWSQRVVKRVHALAVQLATFFLEYGRVGSALISMWNKSRIDLLGWQECLWLRMEKLFFPWNYPVRQYATFTVDQVPFSKDLHVHVFALSYLSSLHHHFLTRMGAHVPVNYYWLSPCQKFWSDLVSDREGIKMSAYWKQRGVALGQQEELEDYLSDNNPLLANFGKLGRKMALQIEESHFLVSDTYVVAGAIRGNDIYEDLITDELLFDATEAPLTLLSAVQADLTLLRNPADAAPLDFVAYDHTIQVHEAPKALREVQIIYDRLIEIIDRHSLDQEPIVPADIIVMAPDIGKYAPFIKSVFGSEESMLNCQIMDLKMPAQNAFVQAFLHLLRLPFGRWDATSLLKLFEYAAFQNRHQLTKEDLQTFRSWFKNADICWGKDSQHRNELLKRDHCFKDMVEDSWAGTWEHGLGRLLEGLAILPDSEKTGSLAPLDQIQSTQSDLLGVLLHLLGSLMDDLKPLSDRTSMTLENWVLYLKCLLEAYFQKGSGAEDSEGYRALIQQFEAFKVAGRKLGVEEFEFHSIYRYLEQALQQQTATYRESCLHAVRFCSLQPMRAIPAKVIVLMGMQEGEFPRNAEQISLNMLCGNAQADYYPSQVEFDRYLFLESLLSARRYLLLSYVSYAPGDSGQALPSPLISELLSYLNKAYRVQGVNPAHYCRFQHALLPFDARYFSQDERFSSYSKMYYEAARAYYSETKLEPHAFVLDFIAPPERVEETMEEVFVTLKDLNAFAKNPMKTYFNKTLGIYPDKEADRLTKKEEDLHLSILDTTILSRKGLFESSASLLATAEQIGYLPRGPFKAIGQNNVLKDVEKLLENLKNYGVQPEDVFSIECSECHTVADLTGKVWLLPALQIATPHGNVKIVGTFDTVCRQGLIQFSKNTFDSAIKAWPSLLVLCCLIKRHALPIAAGVVFAKSSTKSTRTVDFEDAESLLLAYLDYYMKGQNCPSPLLPDWVTPILKKSSEELQNLYQTDPDDNFKPTYDDSLRWLKRNSAHADITSAIKNWHPTAQALFVDLKTAWYSKNAKVSIQESENDLV